jgi:hypothetical protein
MNTESEIKCPYCEKSARLVFGRDIYPNRPDLSMLAFWLCTPCSAWVGCHPGTKKPLGRLADAELRKAKIAAHAALDPLWKNGQMRRQEAYTWLAMRLGIPSEECHIGMFDLEMCRKAVQECKCADYSIPEQSA